MITSFLSDCLYFWINNFRSSNLKKIVIEIKPSSITNQSLKQISLLCDKYSHHRVKALYSIEFVKKFRDELDINSLLQFLIFGQSSNKVRKINLER